MRFTTIKISYHLYPVSSKRRGSTLPLLKGLRFRRRKKRLLVYLARRGARRNLGVIEAGDAGEARERIMQLLERLVEQGDEEVTKYSTIIVVDAETGEEVRFRNPLFRGEEEQVSSGSSSRRFERLAEAIQVQLIVDTARGISEAYTTATREAVRIVVQNLMDIVNEAMKTPFEMMKKQAELQQMVMLEQARQRGPSLGEIAQLINALVALARHRDEVAQLVGEVLSKKGVGEA